MDPFATSSNQQTNSPLVNSRNWLHNILVIESLHMNCPGINSSVFNLKPGINISVLNLKLGINSSVLNLKLGINSSVLNFKLGTDSYVLNLKLGININVLNFKVPKIVVSKWLHSDRAGFPKSFTE